MRWITTKELRTLHIATRRHHTINSRLAILRYAETDGFKGAARRFGLDGKTVRTWHRRWVASGRGRVGAAPSAEATPAAFRGDRTTDRASPPRSAVWGDADAHLA